MHAFENLNWIEIMRRCVAFMGIISSGVRRDIDTTYPLLTIPMNRCVILSIECGTFLHYQRGVDDTRKNRLFY